MTWQLCSMIYTSGLKMLMVSTQSTPYNIRYSQGVLPATFNSVQLGDWKPRRHWLVWSRLVVTMTAKLHSSLNSLTEGEITLRVRISASGYGIRTKKVYCGISVVNYIDPSQTQAGAKILKGSC